jgi:23S rRNA pseudouridine1911/1915/1917 synthase
MQSKIPPNHEGERLDRWLAADQDALSRSRIQQLIQDGFVRVNGKVIKSSFKVSTGDVVDIDMPDPEPVQIRPEDIPLDIFFEDEHVLVVNKPAGMTVHPATGVLSGTLVNALLFHCDHLSMMNGGQRPGIVHRLDKETTGLMMVAKDDVTHRGLAEQLANRTIVRQYCALAWGLFDEAEGRIEAPIGRHKSDRLRMAVRDDGRFAATQWQVIKEYEFTTLLTLQLESGRTHQIRVHLAHLQHAIFGDPVYGGRRPRILGISPVFRSFAQQLLKLIDRQMLHAQKLGFVHPHSGKEMVFEADLPTDMQAVLARLDAV